MPSPVSDRLLSRAGEILSKAVQFSNSISTAEKSALTCQVRKENAHYSNLIEGIESSLKDLPCRVVWASRDKPLGAVHAHIRAQAHFEKLEVFSPIGGREWKDVFAPDLIASLHQHLFEPLSAHDRLLEGGVMLHPGQLRSESLRSVRVGAHEAPDASQVNAMLKRMHQAYGAAGEPRMQLLGALAFHHRLSYVHPFDDGNGRVGRLLLHLQLNRLGLKSSLWPISKALHERSQSYHAAFANADQPRRGDLDGRGQLSQAGLIGFVEFLIDALSALVEEPSAKGH